MRLNRDFSLTGYIKLHVILFIVKELGGCLPLLGLEELLGHFIRALCTNIKGGSPKLNRL